LEREESRRWKKMGRRDIEGAERFLRERELFCPGACGRFLKRRSRQEQVWVLRDYTGSVSALLLYSKRTVFPIFAGDFSIVFSGALERFLRRIPLYAVQGLRDDAEFMEALFSGLGLEPAERKDYDLMALDREPGADSLSPGPEGLVLREPDLTDLEELFPLQTAYELEEVLPAGAVFNPAACRYNLERILAEQRILAAEIGGRLVGKVNISTASFSRYQIGGVFVHPDYRGLGIARRMTAAFIKPLVAEGKGISLFVKKKNTAAQSVYRRIGFRVIEDYRISYY
jgi:predicted GNAT family acetyltransferase